MYPAVRNITSLTFYRIQLRNRDEPVDKLMHTINCHGDGGCPLPPTASKVHSYWTDPTFRICRVERHPITEEQQCKDSVASAPRHCCATSYCTLPALQYFLLKLCHSVSYLHGAAYACELL